jgi:hypothetical protein
VHEQGGLFGDVHLVEHAHAPRPCSGAVAELLEEVIVDEPPRVLGCLCGRSALGSAVVWVDGWPYCRPCWVAAGRPWPQREADMLAAQRALEAARARMTARGGTDRHMVRNGRT